MVPLNPLGPLVWLTVHLRHRPAERQAMKVDLAATDYRMGKLTKLVPILVQ